MLDDPSRRGGKHLGRLQLSVVLRAFVGDGRVVDDLRGPSRLLLDRDIPRLLSS